MGTICSLHWVLRLVIQDTKYDFLKTGIETEIGFVTGIGLCVLSYHTREKRYDLLRHWVLPLVISHTSDLIRALGCVSCDITYETAGTICYGHWVLRLEISHTRQGVRVFTGIGFCVL